MSLSVFRARADAPRELAIVAPGIEITFEQLAERAEFALGWLAAQGVEASADGGPPRIAVVGRPTVETVELMVALISGGVPFFALHPRLAQPQRDAMARRAGITLVVDGNWRDTAAAATRKLDVAPVNDDERPLAVLPTSGSSGDPKGVVLSRRAFVASALASEQNLGWQPNDRWLINMALSHVGGLSIVTRCLLARKTVAIEPLRPNESAVHGVVRALRERSVTLLSLVPTVLHQLLELTDGPPAGLRGVLVGGASASDELIERAHARGWPVLPTYGLTETCSQVATERLGQAPPADGSVGPPLPGVEVRIRNGVIDVRGPILLSSYFPASDRPGLDSEGWFSTDDLGSISESGRLHVLGRKDDVIVTGGENVHPVEVEAALERHPAVRRVCVFGVPNERWGRVVAVAITPAAARAQSDEILAFARRELAEYQRPRLVAFADDLNSTSTGKIDRAATARRLGPKLEPFE